MTMELQKPQIKILFVDDEIEILRSLKRLTRGLAESIYFVNNPLEAIDMVCFREH